MSKKSTIRFQVIGDVHVKEFDGELVILDLAKGDYFGVNDIGAQLWRGLEQGDDCEVIATRLAREYAVDHDALVLDLVALASEFESRGWIEPLEAS